MSPNSGPACPRSGFTLLELVVTLTVIGILSSIAILGTTGTRAGIAVSNAERVFISLSARARGHAIEMGTVVRLHVDPVRDSVWVTRAAGGGGVSVWVDGTSVRREFGVDLSADSTFHVCYTPRGFAQPSCSSSANTRSVTLTRGGRTRTLQVLPLGQVVVP